MRISSREEPKRMYYENSGESVVLKRKSNLNNELFQEYKTPYPSLSYNKKWDGDSAGAQKPRNLRKGQESAREVSNQGLGLLTEQLANPKYTARPITANNKKSTTSLLYKKLTIRDLHV